MMKTYQIDMMERQEIKLVGFSLIESLNNVLESKIVIALREDLEKRKSEVEDKAGSGIYLLQIYSQEGEWTHHAPYQHVIAFAVNSFDRIPKGMITYTVSSGRYVKIVHKGLESQIDTTYEFINNKYGGRSIDIEYWNDIHTLESEEGQIDIYIPAK